MAVAAARRVGRFLADWLTGSQKSALADNLTAFVGHPAYNTQALCADLHRFAFLLGATTAKNSSASRHHDQQHRCSQRT